MKRGELYFAKVGRRWELVRYIGKVRGDGVVGMYEKLSKRVNGVFFKTSIFPLDSSVVGREDRRESVKIILERNLGGSR